MKKDLFKTCATCSTLSVKNMSDETELKIQVFWDLTLCPWVGAF